MNGVIVRVYSKAKNGGEKPYMSNGKRCANFKVSEFACSDGSDPVFIAPELVTILQQIRDHYKKPVTVTGPYRTPTKNKATKDSATYSQHMYGTAADIIVGNKKTGIEPPASVAAYVETLMPKKGGIGIYKDFTHVDVRTVRSRWNG